MLHALLSSNDPDVLTEYGIPSYQGTELTPNMTTSSIDGPQIEPEERNQLGTVNGVYVPCLLNILGAVLFLRIGYAVGYAGVVFTLLIFATSFGTTVLTALSFSSIVTNGKMKGGGPYYMISRSIGPAFGGATGLMFYLCYVFNCAFNATAFVEDIGHTIREHSGVGAAKAWGASDGDTGWAFPIVYHSTLLALGGIAYKGAGAFAKVNTFLFLFLAVAILSTFFSLLTESSNHGAGKAIGSGKPIDCTPIDGGDAYYAHHKVHLHFPLD